MKVRSAVYLIEQIYHATNHFILLLTLDPSIDYCEGEKAFILQSFLAKTLLAWLTVAAFKGG